MRIHGDPPADMLIIPLQIRDDLIVKIQIPKDLTKAEATEAARVVRALASQE